MPIIQSKTSPNVVLGLMTFGPDESAGARITSLSDYKACLDTFQAAGHFTVDTARVYIAGAQEAFTAAAGWQERGLSLATKCYPSRPDQTHEPAALRASLEKSLAELGTKCVDVFYLHAADRAVPFEETLRECNAMHQEGKFVNLGLSNFTAFEVAEVVMTCRQHGWVRPTIYQGMYNAITRSIEAELIPACRRYGLSIVVYNPIAGGLFSGKYSAKDLENAPKEGRFSDNARAGPMYRKRYFKSRTFEALAVIEPVVKKHNLTMLETALRWCVHHSQLQVKDDGEDGIIIGVSSLAQLEGNLKDLQKGPLPEEVVQALDEAWLIAKPDTPNYWHLDLAYTYNTREALFGKQAQL